MKKQLYVFFKPFPVILFVLYVPLVLTFSNCEGSGDRFPAYDGENAEELDADYQAIAVDPAPDCVKTFYYEDWDRDGYGNPDVFVESCTQPDDSVEDNTDCDDGAYYTNPGMAGFDDISGALSNIYTDYLFSGINNDCDEEVDEDQTYPQLPTEPLTHPSFSGIHDTDYPFSP